MQLRTHFIGSLNRARKAEPLTEPIKKRAKLFVESKPSTEFYQLTIVCQTTTLNSHNIAIQWVTELYCYNYLPADSFDKHLWESYKVCNIIFLDFN